MSLDIKLSNDIKLIIECCKENKNNTLIEENIKDIKDWEDFISLSYAHGIFPLVYHTLKQFQNLISENIFQKIKSINMDIVKQNMLMTSELIKVMKLLEENGIEAISFKGPILSQMAYGDISLRQYVDLDILVDEKDLEKASKLLLESNYQETHELKDYQKENLKNLVHDRSFFNKSSGSTVELHWTLSSAEFFIDLEKLDYFKNSIDYKLRNQNLKTLSNEINFIYLCIHGNKHMWERIEWLVDLALLAKKENLNFENIIKLSKEIDADRVILSSVVICEELFQVNFIDNKKYVRKSLDNITKKYIKKLYYDYSIIKNSVHTKHISYIQWYILKTFKNRYKYVKSFLNPTENDYKSINFPKSLSFLYFLIRPFNIIFRK